MKRMLRRLGDLLFGTPRIIEPREREIIEARIAVMDDRIARAREEARSKLLRGA